MDKMMNRETDALTRRRRQGARRGAAKSGIGAERRQVHWAATGRPADGADRPHVRLQRQPGPAGTFSKIDL